MRDTSQWFRSMEKFLDEALKKPGFKLEEIPEWYGRKTFAILLAIAGSILLVSSLYLMAEDHLGSGLFLLLVAIVMLGYAVEYDWKINHIMWTRQALREYGALSGKDFYEWVVDFYAMNIESMSEEEVRKFLEVLEDKFAKKEISEKTYMILKPICMRKLNEIS